MNDAVHPLLRSAYRWRLLLLLMLTNTLSFVDRAIMSVVVEPMRHDLGLSDAQIGILQGLAFAFIYALIGIPIGRLAERRNRPWIIGVAIIVFSAATGLCGFASSFLQLFLLRMMVGVGEGGFMAPATSLVADHFPPARRASALAVILCGMPCGFLIGSIVGGQVVQHHGWRMGFMVMSVPGLIVAALLLFGLKEPPRGLAEGGHTRPAVATPPFGAVLRHLFAQPAFRQMLIGAVLCTCGSNAIGQFQVSFFARVHHLPIAMAAMTSGLISFFSLAPGMLIGGNVVDRIQRLDERWYLWTPAIGAAVGSGFFVLGFYQVSLAIGVPLIIVGGILLFLHYAPCYALVQLIAGVRQRASAVAIYGVFLGLLGSGLGPTITGIVSTFVARRQFALGNLAALCPGGRALQPGGAIDHACQAASASGMRAAMITGAVLMLWGALHFLLGARTISRALAAGRA
ncbi:spinster family MFS transporter [Sphingomonas sp. MMS24-J13]|uniref:spinster family MFS transporter n=1 Tax=Sphingomonas sp. MMS24-J13 TaxID=3238686 RepID=UPI00384E6134